MAFQTCKLVYLERKKTKTKITPAFLPKCQLIIFTQKFTDTDITGILWSTGEAASW
jgi:hypothetical protein